MGPEEAADTVYHNGRIYTVDESQPWVEALAVKDGRFMVVGTADDVMAVAGDDTEIVDLGGAFVMPGVVDAHVHPFDVYTQEENGNLLFSDQLDADGVAVAIRDYAAANPDKTWIRGMKYGFGAFPGAKMTREWLDEIVPDRPAYIVDESGHNATANSLALEMAGITADTPDPRSAQSIVTRSPANRPGICPKPAWAWWPDTSSVRLRRPTSALWSVPWPR
jgi:predicted amidohydrolase YtcJ